MNSRRRLAIVAGLLAATGSAWAMLPILQHAGMGGAGMPPLPRLTVTGSLIDPAAPGDVGALNVELYGDVVVGVAPDHAGYTLCEGRCQMPPPSRSKALAVGAASRLVLAGAWQAPSGAVVRVDAAGGVLQVRGALDAQAGLTVRVTGSPGALPAALISANLITGAITAGDLPAGTALAVTTTTILLIAAD